MDKIDLQERFDELNSLVNSRASTPKAIYWPLEPYGEEWEDYCYDCLMAILPQDAEFGEHYCGGERGHECDGTRWCEKCGCLLDYTLTDFGVGAELEHFTDHMPDISDADECFQLARIAGGIYKDDQIAAFVALFDTPAPSNETE